MQKWTFGKGKMEDLRELAKWFGEAVKKDLLVMDLKKIIVENKHCKEGHVKVQLTLVIEEKKWRKNEKLMNGKEKAHSNMRSGCVSWRSKVWNAKRKQANFQIFYSILKIFSNLFEI